MRFATPPPTLNYIRLCAWRAHCSQRLDDAGLESGNVFFCPIYIIPIDPPPCQKCRDWQILV